MLPTTLTDDVDQRLPLQHRAAAAHAPPLAPPPVMLAPVTAPGPSPARAVLKAGHVKQITSFFQNMTVAPEPSGAQRQKSRLSHSSGVPANNKENVVVADDDCDSPLLGKGRVRADCCCLVRTS